MNEKEIIIEKIFEPKYAEKYYDDKIVIGIPLSINENQIGECLFQIGYDENGDFVRINKDGTKVILQ